MKKELYILIAPNDESGNDDGIRGKKELTSEEVFQINNGLFESKSELRWVKQHQRRQHYVTFYSPEYYS